MIEILRYATVEIYRRQGIFLSLRYLVSCTFDAAGESMIFAHGMLTESAQAQLHAELRRLRNKLAALHDESASAALQDKRGTALMLAMRTWEPAAFRNLRRAP
jgi:hypothetical protein